MKWTKKGHELEEQWEALKGGCFYIYGAGDYGARMSRTLSKLGIEFAFVDGNYSKQQNGYLGKKVISPVELVERPEKKLIILAAMETRCWKCAGYWKSMGWKRTGISGIWRNLNSQCFRFMHGMRWGRFICLASVFYQRPSVI